MKKSIKIILLIVAILIICLAVIFTIDYSRVKNLKEPIFNISKYEEAGLKEFKGLGYKTIMKYAYVGENYYMTNIQMNIFNNVLLNTAIDYLATTENKELDDGNYACLIRVNGVIYIWNGNVSENVPRCGVMDGKVTYNGDPTGHLEDNQCNFEGEYDFQYGNKTIEVYKNEQWLIFERLKNQVVLRINCINAEDLFKEYTLEQEGSYIKNLINKMQYRNHTCDGIADYQINIEDKNYGIEVFENEIHIIPYNDVTDKEAVITGEDFIKIKQILDEHPLYEI